MAKKKDKSKADHRDALDAAAAAVAKLGPVRGPIRPGPAEMWNPRTNPVTPIQPPKPKPKES